MAAAASQPKKIHFAFNNNKLARCGAEVKLKQLVASIYTQCGMYKIKVTRPRLRR